MKEKYGFIIRMLCCLQFLTKTRRICTVLFKIPQTMYFFADFLVLWCLFAAGYFFGNYYKYTFIYDNYFPHWYAFLGVITALTLAIVWTLQKHRRKQYCFNHYYIIFYGLICFLISACFMLTDNMSIAFYFGFIGLSTIFMASFSFISLRCTSRGLRPMRVGLGNMLFFMGVTTGFILFNEFEPEANGWSFFGITVTMLLGTVIVEVLQYKNIQCYKKSCDLVFNLMNDEKLVFLPTKSVYALFTDRPEFYVTRNLQWLVVGISGLAALEQVFVFSCTYLQLAWSSTFGYLTTQYLYGPFLLFTIGCAIGTGLVTRYKPKLIYLMFGLIKITVMAAILGVYSDDNAENCFYFLCFYNISMGVYSSIALQLVLECTPFLYTELALALTLLIKLCSLELSKYEVFQEDTWTILLGVTISSMLLTVLCLIVVPLFVPSSEGLIEIRNHLLGIRRHSPVVPQTKIWSANYFLQHDMQPNEFSNVCFDGNRIFQQYPRVGDKI